VTPPPGPLGAPELPEPAELEPVAPEPAELEELELPAPRPPELLSPVEVRLLLAPVPLLPAAAAGVGDDEDEQATARGNCAKIQSARSVGKHRRRKDIIEADHCTLPAHRHDSCVPGPMNTTAKAYLIGGGIGNMAAAAFMIRDGGMPGENIVVFEAAPVLGGSLDAAGTDIRGYSMRGGRMLTHG
jgi:hypothetical protein